MSDDGAFLLTVGQTAELLQISRDTAYELIHRGEIPHIKIGRIIRVPRAGVGEWIRREAGLPLEPAQGVDFPRQGFQHH